MANAGALATVESMQNVVGAPVVALAQNQKLDYIENVDQTKYLQGILGGIMKMYSVLLDIKEAQNVQTVEVQEANEIQKDERRAIEDTAGERSLEGGDIPMAERLGQITKMIGTKLGEYGKKGFEFTKGIGKFFAGKGPLVLLLGGLFLLRTQLDGIVKAMTPVIESIRDNVIPPLINFYEKIIKPFVTTFIEGLGKGLPSLFEGLGSIIEGIVNIFSGDIIKGIKNIFGGFGSMLKGVGDFILNFFGTSVDQLWNDTKSFFQGILDGIKAPFIAVYEFMRPGGTADQWLQDSIYAPIDNFFASVKQFFINLWDGAVEAVQNTFKSIGNFFSSLVDKIKTAINGLIESLPLPQFLKDKIKLQTTETKEQGNKVSEFGVKEKYTDRSLNPEERQKKASPGQFITNEEALKEAEGEGYTTPRLTQTINGNVEQVSGILNRDQMQEFLKLSYDEQFNYLKNLDDAEQTRRQLITKLARERREFLKNQSEQSMIPERKLMSPDDEMNRYTVPKVKRNIPTIEKGNMGGSTVVNSPVNSSGSTTVGFINNKNIDDTFTNLNYVMP